MKLSYRNRIAFYYMIATASVMALVFGLIFLIVSQTIWKNLDDDLSFEAKKHTTEIKIIGDSIKFINKAEWEEREHQEIQVNPVFIQLIDKEGRVMDKSPNLKQNRLPFNASEFGGHFDAELSSRAIRQVQLPVESEGKIQGYILAAMSSEASHMIITKLRNALFISYCFLLIGLYFISRFLAGRSISPVRDITQTISRITQNNLKERVSLPQHKDEIYDLSANFNDLIQRIENAIDREKQFTSDASHELRTPLATLRGTLEVLIRKPRSPDAYEEKIRYSLREIDRMTATLEQLLLLARLDNTAKRQTDLQIALSALIHESVAQFKNLIAEKHIKVDLHIDSAPDAMVHPYYAKIIIENVLGNAIKYSGEGSSIHIGLHISNGRPICTIKDEGVGIKDEDLNHVFDSFFRSDALNHKHISGNGLGLAIAKKCADAICAELKVTSTYGQGTEVIISF